MLYVILCGKKGPCAEAREGLEVRICVGLGMVVYALASTLVVCNRVCHSREDNKVYRQIRPTVA